MSYDAQEAIKRINSLRQRVKSAEQAAATARVHHEQAQADFETAKAAAKELGIDPDDLRAFERFLAEESAFIDRVITEASARLEQVRSDING